VLFVRVATKRMWRIWWMLCIVSIIGLTILFEARIFQPPQVIQARFMSMDSLDPTSPEGSRGGPKRCEEQWNANRKNRSVPLSMSYFRWQKVSRGIGTREERLYLPKRFCYRTNLCLHSLLWSSLFVLVDHLGLSSSGTLMS
jgi:hypothetical protein